MTGAWTSFKIGLLTLAVVASAVVIALALGVRPGPKKTVRYHTYFDESVVGLDVGAPAKYRGISIGVVDAIGVGPDGRTVDVTIEIDAKNAWMLDWRVDHDSGLRAQVGAPGILGVKLIDLEYLDPAAHPPPRLPFPAPENYIPSASSFGLSEAIETITDALVGTLHRVERLVENMDAQEVPQRLAAALASVDGAASDLRTTVRRVNHERIPDRTADLLARLDEAIGSMQRILRRVDADGGLLTGAERATRSVDGLGVRAAGVTDELDRTVRDLGDAARTVRSLADAIERDPDILLKGRQKGVR